MSLSPYEASPEHAKKTMQKLEADFIKVEEKISASKRASPPKNINESYSPDARTYSPSQAFDSNGLFKYFMNEMDKFKKESREKMVEQDQKISEQNQKIRELKQENAILMDENRNFRQKINDLVCENHNTQAKLSYFEERIRIFEKSNLSLCKSNDFMKKKLQERLEINKEISKSLCNTAMKLTKSCTEVADEIGSSSIKLNSGETETTSEKNN